MAKSAGRKSIERRVGSLALSTAVVLLGLLGPVVPAYPQAARLDIGAAPRNMIPPQLLIGDWLTIIRIDDRPQPVRLQIHTVEPGKTAGKLIYSSPKRCFVDLEYGGPDGDEHIFYIVPFTNCFRYGKADYIAFTAAEPIPGASSDLTRQAKDYRLMSKDQKASAGTSDSDADPQKGGAKAPKVESMRYTITLNRRRVEIGLLTRQ